MKTGHNNVVIQFFFYYFDVRGNSVSLFPTSNTPLDCLNSPCLTSVSPATYCLVLKANQKPIKIEVVNNLYFYRLLYSLVKVIKEKLSDDIWKFHMSGSAILILVFFENLLDFFQVSCNTLLIDSSLIL